ncbi:hypothetical protein V9T40_011879 [Parthenolecanium corni]|uniref:Uncharacterized protein n=1 Tax=Parthenolecanium corni TaxID=536013 RepID=A0AAN9T690_9HEMI
MRCSHLGVQTDQISDSPRVTFKLQHLTHIPETTCLRPHVVVSSFFPQSTEFFSILLSRLEEGVGDDDVDIDVKLREKQKRNVVRIVDDALIPSAGRRHVLLTAFPESFLEATRLLEADLTLRLKSENTESGPAFFLGNTNNFNSFHILPDPHIGGPERGD